MARRYTLGKRAETQSQTRERIIRATMQVHDEKGVAPTTFADIAARAGVGPATVSRHFAELGDLIQACGVHVWQEMRPPVPAEASAVFTGIRGSAARLAKLVDEIDSFYERGAFRLDLASRDRDLIPQLDGFLGAVEAGIAALVAEALAPEAPDERTLRVVTTLLSFRVWQAFSRSGIPAGELRPLLLRMVTCGLRSASAG